ncbi:MAG TPA: MBL fold metallo-hydrolase [Halothiobacillaceae bacterium]|nr:MBL fold metallo-hydrolase [Halothiobacillaceae bacterium]
MLFETFEDPGLSQLSYAIGCQSNGEMAIIDPRRDVDIYLEFAKAEGFTIKHVLDTHIHADFASGARELAEATGAELHLSGYDEGEQFDVQFKHTPMFDGDRVVMGNVAIEALFTPGHTPEHISFLIYDGARSKDVPAVACTGDFLFVGSLGRPDLLGEKATRGLAQLAFQSVREKLKHLPDSLEIRPGHGSGSACGAGMAGRQVSTLGYERATNPLLNPELSEDEFIELLLSNLPPAPDFYPRNKVTNSDGPRSVRGMVDLDPAQIQAFSINELKQQVEKGATIVDIRDQLAFNAAHIKGSLGIEFGNDLSTWGGWVVPPDHPIILVDYEGDPELISEAIRALVRVGQDYIVGYLENGFTGWMKAGEGFEHIPLVDVYRARADLESGQRMLIDMREPSEWQAGHAPNARHIPAHLARGGLDGISPDEPINLICASGMRSTVASSILLREGYSNVVNVIGGMDAWERAGLPMQQD